MNILKPGDTRLRSSQVASSDLVQVEDSGGKAVISLPKSFSGTGWRPKELHPLEVIDGQHRLWAFEEGGLPGNFELPVVAFHGLDISWQAYLFWTINIKPKRINASLAFDLYPLLRAEDWLDKFEGHSIYRETRAQELTETLWSHPESPWLERINMLGESGVKGVSQAAWIRSLMATYVKSFEGRGVSVGGLFGAPTGKDKLVLPWSRQQQAAFLIAVWREIRDAVKRSKTKWATALRDAENSLFKSGDVAFDGQLTLLNQDQGVRTVLHVTNDLCFVANESLKLADWTIEQRDRPDHAVVSQALKSLSKQSVSQFLAEIAKAIADYDWRTATAPGLSEQDRLTKLVFRGSGGYAEFRRQVLGHMIQYPGRVAKAARTVLQAIG
jgi:hypothetical protein